MVRNTSGTHFRSLLLRHGIYLLIFGVFMVSVSVLFFLRRTSPATPIAVPKPVPAVRRVFESPLSVNESVDTLAHFQATAFYPTIIDNNLFRRLGFSPAVEKEPYRLIGTLLPRDANTPPKAIIESTAGEQTYIVSTGEKIDASTRLVSIESKSVRLSTNGEQRTLKLRSGF